LLIGLKLQGVRLPPRLPRVARSGAGKRDAEARAAEIGYLWLVFSMGVFVYPYLISSHHHRHHLQYYLFHQELDRGEVVY